MLMFIEAGVTAAEAAKWPNARVMGHFKLGKALAPNIFNGMYLAKVQKCCVKLG